MVKKEKQEQQLVINKRTANSNMAERIILDAGHGIPDGGAVGVDGTTEQELNLKLVLKIQECLAQKNISALLTREDQNGIYTEGKSIHDQKISDIKNRVKLLSQYSEIPVISIHMNSFTDPSVHGIQVFYKDGDSPSMELAKKLQERINAVIRYAFR